MSRPGFITGGAKGAASSGEHATTKTCERRVPHKASMPSPPSGGVVLERLLMLGAVALIAFGILTAFFRRLREVTVRQSLLLGHAVSAGVPIRSQQFGRTHSCVLTRERAVLNRGATLAPVQGRSKRLAEHPPATIDGRPSCDAVIYAGAVHELNVRRKASTSTRRLSVLPLEGYRNARQSHHGKNVLALPSVWRGLE